MTMTVVNGRHPPNIDKIDAKFNVKDQKNILYCYGQEIFNPSKCEVPEHIFVHEMVHSVRQGSDVEGWWDRYISDPVFRLDEEIVAHRAEWGQYVKNNLDKNQRIRYFNFICYRLSGELYDRLLTFPEARKRILMA